LKSRIRQRLYGKQHLIPIESSAFKIPERLREIDKSLFVCFNAKRQSYEVHCLDNVGDTFALNVGLELDARVIELVRRNSLLIHGRKVFDEIDEHNAEVERKNQRDRDSEIKDVARELHKPVKRLAYWGE